LYILLQGIRKVKRKFRNDGDIRKIGIVQHALHALHAQGAQHALICAEDWRAGWQRAENRLKEKPAGINLPAANEMVIIKALLQ
jgi:hypothetical protein